jgi:nucleotide-binding universal stress UspA family protein
MLPIHTILQPTDFSEQAQDAFGLACALARDYGARLVVLHVASVPIVPFEPALVPPSGEEVRRAGEEQLARVHPPPTNVQFERRVEVGDVVPEVLRVAHEIQPDLIVMGTHGRTGLGRILMRSVAEQVVRRAKCPVLTVKTPLPETGLQAGRDLLNGYGVTGDGEMLTFRSILHPTDFSPNSRYAFELACGLARDYHARLVVMHAVPLGTTELMALTQLGTQEKTENLRDSFWSDLRKIRAKDSDIRVEHRSEDGDPASGILRVAQQIKPEIIVMGMHEHSGPRRLLMGSVAEQTVRKAACPVLTVKVPAPIGSNESQDSSHAQERRPAYHSG